jgi:hypothetical protein
VVLQRFTVSVTIVVGSSLNVTRVTVLVLVNVCSEERSDVWVDRESVSVLVFVCSVEWTDVRVDREIVMVFNPRLVLNTRVRRVEVMVRVIRVGEAVEDSTRVGVS